MGKKGYAHQQGLKEKELPAAKVMIAVPGATWQGDFGMCLMTLLAASTQPVEGYSRVDLAIQNSKGSILPQLRQRLVDAAIEAEATHILFLDTDMVFPPYLLNELLKHKRPVVACNCPTKCLPSSPTARFKGPDYNGTPVFQQDFVEREDPLLGVWRVGTGVMLINMEVFTQISSPYFPIQFDEQLNDYVGEDWGFCEKLEEAGIPILLDVHLSHTIKHVGNLAYGHEHTVQLPNEPYDSNNQNNIILPD